MYRIIEKLISLQEIDAKIYELRDEKEKKPAILEAIKQEYKDLEENLKQLQNKLKQLQIERKNKEMELDNKEENIKKYQMQLYQVKTNKEYSSLQKEIAGIKADNSLLEDEIIDLLEKIEELEKLISNKKQELEKVNEKLSQNERKVKEDIAIIDDELFKLKRRRDNIISDIAPEVVEKYEKILENRDGEALAPIEHNTCGGCQMNLPPQVINEVKLGKLVSCENCNRILYIK